MKTTLCLLAMLTMYWSLTHGDQTKKCSNDMSPKGGRCGGMLSDMIAFVCGGKTFRGSRQMRSVGNDTGSAIDHSKFIKKRSAFTFLTTPDHTDMFDLHRFERKKHGRYAPYYQGLVCECCMHPCSLQEMCYYCEEKNACLMKYSRNVLLV